VGWNQILLTHVPEMKLFLPAAAVFAAWAAQPNVLAAAGDVARLLALVLVGVPPGPYEVVLQVCRHLLVHAVHAFPCRSNARVL